MLFATSQLAGMHWLIPAESTEAMYDGVKYSSLRHFVHIYRDEKAQRGVAHIGVCVLCVSAGDCLLFHLLTKNSC